MPDAAAIAVDVRARAGESDTLDFKADFEDSKRCCCEIVKDIVAMATQAELAERIGWQQTDISKVERGERRLDVVEFLQFADALGADPAELVRRLQQASKR
jgi:ribosome-binding protein aMBF1 (putative translation factor)